MKRAVFHFQSRRGSVFIAVLVISLGLVSLALFFGHSMFMAFRGADNEVAGREAQQAVEGAARYVEWLMANVSRAGDFPEPALYANQDASVGNARFWLVGNGVIVSSTTVITGSSGGNEPTFGLVDEASKLNLNSASQEMLQMLPGMTPELAAAIIAWRTPLTDGTTGMTTISTTPIKHAPFESVWELALLTGTNLALLNGEDANLNHMLDKNEDDGDRTLPLDNRDGRIDPGLLEYVTVFSREPNVRSDGSERLNVAAPVRELRALGLLFFETFGADRTREIFQNILSSGGAVRNIVDFYIRSKMTEEEFDQVSDELTGKKGDYITGLVNVNTASEAVLACIPGIGVEKVQQLVAARKNRATLSTNLAWIVPVLGNEAAIQAAPYLTTRSYQVSADVVAVGRHGRGFRRNLFIIDSSTGTPRIVYRRNLAFLGWPLGSRLRATPERENLSQ